MSQPQDPRRYDRLAVDLSRLRDPQELAEAIVAAAREPQPAAPPPVRREGERAWIDA
jgi:hypothetical protein